MHGKFTILNEISNIWCCVSNYFVTQWSTNSFHTYIRNCQTYGSFFEILRGKFTLFREGGLKFADVEEVLDKCDWGCSSRCLWRQISSTMWRRVVWYIRTQTYQSNPLKEEYTLVMKKTDTCWMFVWKWKIGSEVEWSEVKWSEVIILRKCVYYHWIIVMYVGSVQYFVSLLFASLCCFLIDLFFSIFILYSFLFCIFVFCFVYSLFCIVFCIVLPFVLPVSYLYTSLSITATGWKPNCSKYISSSTKAAGG